MTAAPAAEPGSPAPLVLVADDEEAQRYFLERALRRRGYRVAVAAGGEEALRLFRRGGVACVLLDVRMPDLPGPRVLDEILKLRPDQPIVMMTAYATVREAVEALRRGASDYLTKPATGDEVGRAVGRALEGRALRDAEPERREAEAAGAAFGGLLGAGRAMRKVYGLLERAAASDATVLLSGESGTGKDLAAHELHRRSPRAAGPFVAVACAELPETLLAGELFGVRPGAYTGAAARPGRFARAHGGTLLLDEVGEIPLAVQATLLRVLSERAVTPLGGDEATPVDVRIVAATNRDLSAAVSAKAFREDLYWRLRVIPIEMPPLRDRREDIPLLARHFLEGTRAERGARPLEFGVEAMVLLSAYSWPGNVRELENVVRRLAALAPGPEVRPEDLPPEVRAELEGVPAAGGEPGRAPLKKTLADVERRYLEELLESVGGNVSRAARLAGVSRPNLHRRLEALGLDPDRFRGKGGEPGPAQSATSSD